MTGFGGITALLRMLPPEAAHRLTIRALALGLAPRAMVADDPILACHLWRRDFANPLGLAAGFDKDGEAIPALAALGFGFVEIGSVTPEPQPGNPKPRLFRLPEDHAVINRMGFNSQGHAAVARRLATVRRRGGGRGGTVGAIIGINLGKNRDSADAAADYAAGVAAFAGLADYLVINVSSPNTPGLHRLQERAALARLLARTRAALPGDGPPVLVKIAPDLAAEDMRGVADIARAGTVDGIIVTNSTRARPETLRGASRREAGGLSGRPLFAQATRVLGEMYRLTEGRVPLVGCGGVASADDAYAKIRAGASLVQLYTALVYEGPMLVARIKAGLAARLRADGFTGIAQAVGAAHR